MERSDNVQPGRGFGRMSKTRTEVVKTGVTFGAVLAIVISWSYNHSVLWAILHGILSWIYVEYHIFFH